MGGVFLFTFSVHEIRMRRASCYSPIGFEEFDEGRTVLFLYGLIVYCTTYSFETSKTNQL